MSNNLKNSQYDSYAANVKVKNPYYETVIALLIIIPVMLVGNIILDRFLPARDYGVDPYMEEFCSYVKVLPSEHGTIPIANLASTYKCRSYYAMKVLKKTMLP